MSSYLLEVLNAPLLSLLTILIGFVGCYYLFTTYKNKKKQQEFESSVKYFKQHRKFRNKNDNEYYEEKENDELVRVMSYNILAPDPSGNDNNNQYAMGSKHDYCPRKYRYFKYRLPRIMAEIIAYKPDIVCMQETTRHSFENYLKNEFNKINYNGWHEIRNRNIVKATEAIFWNKNKFKCIKKKVLRLDIICDELKKEVFEKYIGTKNENNSLYKMLKDRKDILMVIHFENIITKKELIICSSHLFYHPNWSDIKLLECLLLNMSLYNLLKNEWKLINDNNNNNNIGIIFGVDANSLPIKTKSDEWDQNIQNGQHLISGVYQLMTKGFVDKNHNDHPSTRVNLRNYQEKHWEYNNDNDNELKEQINFVKNISEYTNDDYNKLIWNSSYNDANKNEPIYTTKTDDFQATIDYIFYNDYVKQLSYLEMPYQNNLHKKELNISQDSECSEKLDFFPNTFYPSDHIALVADFKLLY